MDEVFFGVATWGQDEGHGIVVTDEGAYLFEDDGDGGYPTLRPTNYTVDSFIADFGYEPHEVSTGPYWGDVLEVCEDGTIQLEYPIYP